jgi:hypothetical protein
MRKLIAPIAALSMLGLASCQTAGLSGADITNDIGLACGAAQQLLALPSVVSPATSTVALTASRLASKVNLYCTGAQLAAPIIAAALGELTTAGARLLGTGVAKR